MNGSWFERLEAELEKQLESFLSSHPEQQDLLELEERQERQRRLRRRQQEIRTQADQLRQSLLELAAEINQWQARVARARAAGAHELAARADTHLGRLMGHGRDRWQALSELGAEFRRLEAELAAVPVGEQRRSPPPPSSGSESGNDLEQAWASFEAREELEALKRKAGS
jgi:hercynine metabolism protein